MCIEQSQRATATATTNSTTDATEGHGNGNGNGSIDAAGPLHVLRSLQALPVQASGKPDIERNPEQRDVKQRRPASKWMRAVVSSVTARGLRVRASRCRGSGGSDVLAR